MNYTDLQNSLSILDNMNKIKSDLLNIQKLKLLLNYYDNNGFDVSSSINSLNIQHENINLKLKDAQVNLQNISDSLSELKDSISDINIPLVDNKSIDGIEQINQDISHLSDFESQVQQITALVHNFKNIN